MEAFGDKVADRFKEERDRDHKAKELIGSSGGAEIAKEINQAQNLSVGLMLNVEFESEGSRSQIVHSSKGINACNAAEHFQGSVRAVKRHIASQGNQVPGQDLMTAGSYSAGGASVKSQRSGQTCYLGIV